MPSRGDGVEPSASPGTTRGDAVIDLAAGHPDASLLPVDLLRRAAQAAFTAGRAPLLNYGAERGDDGFRHRLARFLERETGTSVPTERLFVTAGASMALDLLCTLLTVPGDVVVVAEPTYHLALRTFADHGLRVESVPSDGRGLDVDALADLLERVPARLIYMMPSFANPSGVSMPVEGRRRLLDLVAERHLWLVADDVYALLPHDGSSPARFGGDDDEQVVTLGSFSKILAPALRLGWIDAPPDLVVRLQESGLLQSGGGLSPLSAAFVADLLDGRLERHVDVLRTSFAARAAALATALRSALPEARFDLPGGGYFIWCRVPGVDADALLAEARREGVIYQPGSRFAPHRDFRDHLRLSFSRHDARALTEGAARLARAVESQRARPRRAGTPLDGSDV